MTSAEVTSVDTSGKGVKATVKTKKGEEVLEADIILSAVGIKTNIENSMLLLRKEFYVLKN